MSTRQIHFCQQQSYTFLSITVRDTSVNNCQIHFCQQLSDTLVNKSYTLLSTVRYPSVNNSHIHFYQLSDTLLSTTVRYTCQLSDTLLSSYTNFCQQQFKYTLLPTAPVTHISINNFHTLPSTTVPSSMVIHSSVNKSYTLRQQVIST